MLRLTLLLLLVFFCAIGQSQNKPTPTLSCDFDSVKIENAFLQLEQNYPVKFFYKTNWLKEIKITSHFENESLENAMDKLLYNTGLFYLIYKNNYVLIGNRPLQDNLLFAGLGEKDKSAIFAGKVVKANTGEVLPNANVYVEDMEIGTTTNQLGEFELVVPYGLYIVTFKSLGLAPASYSVRIPDDHFLKAELTEKSIQLDEFSIYEEKRDLNVSSNVMGIEKIDIKRIEELPSFLGEPEVIQNILLMPGVTSAGEGAMGFSARGGGTDQNLILFDHLQIFNANHLFGFFSVFNPDVVRKVSLFKGNTPAMYGGRASSVLEVTSKDGDLKSYHGLLSVGAVNSRLFLEGPLVKDKLSFLVAGRYAYPNWILQSIKNDNIVNQRAKFYDGNFKLTFWANQKNKFELNAYSSQDFVKLSLFNSNSWETNLGGITWNSELNPKLNLNTAVGVVRYRSEISDITSSSKRKLSSSIKNLHLESTATYAFTSENNVAIGISGNYYMVSPGQVVSENFLTGTSSQHALAENYAMELGVYLQHDFTLFQRLSIGYGMRISPFYHLGEGTVFAYEEGVPKTEKTLIDSLQFNKNQVIQKYFGWEPRFSVRYGITENMSVKMALNRTFQYLHRISNTAAPQPINVWQISNPHIKPLKADQVSIGLYKNFKSNLYETSIEVYYKKFKDLLDYKNGADLVFNPRLETELLSGVGKAYGVEFKASRTRSRLDGTIAYTYSRTLTRFNSQFKEERINNGEYYPANYDKPHEFTLAANYDFTQRYNFSFQFVYGKGRPFTGPVAKYVIGNDGQIILPHFSKRNQFRIPDYHRLDVSFNYKKGHKKNTKIYSQWSFSIYNVYGRKNIYSIYFKQEPQKQSQAYELSIIGIPVPAVSYQIRF